MSLRTASHTDLQADPSPVGPWKPPSPSSRPSRSREAPDEAPGVPRPCRRPVRAVRPVSALAPSAPFLQISRLQGELVRKRKECEDLKQQNKFLSNEIHMERIVMRTESELTMRSLRALNQELQAHIKELKQKLQSSQQRATLCSRVTEEVKVAWAEAEDRASDSQRERDQALSEKLQLDHELQQLKSQHADMQLLLTQNEKNLFEIKLKVDRMSAERQVLLEENRDLELDRDQLRRSLKQLTEENAKLKEKEESSRHQALAAEDQCERATRAQRDAQREHKLAEEECLVWKEKHQALWTALQTQKELQSQRQNRACQANIRSYFLCVAESNQRIKVLKNADGSPRNFTEGDPVYISTVDAGNEEPEGTDVDRYTVYRVTAPSAPKSSVPAHFCEVSPLTLEASDSAPPRRGRTIIEYFWLPTDNQ
ncbi:transmembrane and coiled-coil domain-containing protein 5A [Arapaima gigas]